YPIGAHGLLAARDHSMFILPASLCKLPVQIGHIYGLRHRRPVIPAKISDFSFDAALLLRLGRRAKLSFESPVRTEGYKPGRLFPPRSAKYPLHRRRQVVVTKLAKHAAKVRERQLVRF